MFQWLKRRLTGWAEARQRQEIARLQQKARVLKEEFERTTGEPLSLTPEQRRWLAEKAKGIDPQTLCRFSVLDPAELVAPDRDSHLAENRYRPSTEPKPVIEVRWQPSILTTRPDVARC